MFVKDADRTESRDKMDLIFRELEVSHLSKGVDGPVVDTHFALFQSCAEDD
jgi:hypothetical protein